MAQTNPQPSLRDIARNPVAYVLLVMGVFAGAVGTAFIATNNNRSASSEERAKTCETRLYEVQQVNQQLVRDLLISRGALESVSPAVDSLRKR